MERVYHTTRYHCHHTTTTTVILPCPHIQICAVVVMDSSGVVETNGEVQLDLTLDASSESTCVWLM